VCSESLEVKTAIFAEGKITSLPRGGRRRGSGTPHRARGPETVGGSPHANEQVVLRGECEDVCAETREEGESG
jgi:hypothetical protein